jgi:hypothetical protein
MTQIKFGTDGWRGIIADDFTFENVRRVAGAIASYILKHEDATQGIIIGYDTRFAVGSRSTSGGGGGRGRGHSGADWPMITFRRRRFLSM